jgi:hypothetical protein
MKINIFVLKNDVIVSDKYISKQDNFMNTICDYFKNNLLTNEKDSYIITTSNIIINNKNNIKNFIELHRHYDIISNNKYNDKIIFINNNSIDKFISLIDETKYNFNSDVSDEEDEIELKDIIHNFKNILNICNELIGKTDSLFKIYQPSKREQFMKQYNVSNLIEEPISDINHHKYIWSSIIKNNEKMKIVCDNKLDIFHDDIFDYLLNDETNDMIIFTNYNVFDNVNKFLEKYETNNIEYVISHNRAQKILKYFSQQPKNNFIKIFKQYIRQNHKTIKFIKKIFIGKKMPMITISLERAKERRNNIIKRFGDSKIFDLKIINGLDARQAETIDNKYENNSEKGTVYCRFSHIKAQQYLIDKNIEYGMIVEDDIGIVKNITIDDINELDITNYDMIWNNIYVRKMHKDGKCIINPWEQSACSYILTRTGAKNLLKQFETYDLYDKYKICYVDAIMMLWCNENVNKWNILDEGWFKSGEFVSLIHTT